jgi:phosphatidylinositol-3,4,5-trisphosphate 3-phosphatase/dual-specificity protein phosphatase PTEN
MSENKSLDLSAIAPRMYAMSYPSENFIESMYHNDQNDIAEYFNKKHPNKYLIFNLSGIPYTSKSKFNDKVIDYFWPDHKAPPLYDIFNIIEQAFDFLKKDKDNVICVHCLAGKGRTGTICCSLLLYGKLCYYYNQANDYFSYKRFKQLNKGVQEPSQLRYLKYLDNLIQNRKYIDLKAYEIKDVYITGIKLKNGESITYKYETNYYKENASDIYKSNMNGQIVVGDVTINIYRNEKLIGWVFFNTNCEEIKNKIIFYDIRNIDPRFLLKDEDYSLMTVEINIIPFNLNNPGNKANLLVDDMIGSEMERIKQMNTLLGHVYKDGHSFFLENVQLFFGKEKNNIYDVLREINAL